MWEGGGQRRGRGGLRGGGLAQEVTEINGRHFGKEDVGCVRAIWEVEGGRRGV